MAQTHSNLPQQMIKKKNLTYIHSVIGICHSLIIYREMVDLNSICHQFTHDLKNKKTSHIKFELAQTLPEKMQFELWHPSQCHHAIRSRMPQLAWVFSPMNVTTKQALKISFTWSPIKFVFLFLPTVNIHQPIFVVVQVINWQFILKI